jgi:hypothetical protein
MSGHFSERFNPREAEDVGERAEQRAQEVEDERSLTPPLSLIGGDAGQTPEAAEERASGIDLDANPVDRKRQDES